MIAKARSDAGSGAIGRVAILCAVMAMGQIGLCAPEGTTDDSNTASVFVPDSPAALERFALAQKLEKASEWSKAAEIYQELLDRYRDRVVASSDSAGFYTSVAERAMRQLTAWPAEGRTAYNGKFQPAADALLQQAHDPSALQAVADRYLLTRAGQAAAYQLLDHYWRSGEAAACARLCEQLLLILPENAPERPMLLYRQALAWRLGGVDARASAVLDQLRKSFPAATGRIAGEDTKLSDALAAALASATTSGAPLESWRAYGGAADRAAIPAFGGRSDALLFSVPIGSSRTDAEQPGVPSPMAARAMLNQTLGIHPVYDNRQLFFLDNTNLYGVSIEGGMKLPHWSATSVQLANSPAMGPMLRALALDDDSAYCVMSDLAFPTYMVDIGGAAPTDSSSIVCVDRLTGTVRWRITPQSLSQAMPSLKSLQFASPPLVVGDRLFVAARGGRNAQFHDVYLMCIWGESGKVAWCSYVASGPNMSMNMMEETATPLEAGLPQLSYNAGRVIVVTNVGAVASLEASDGTPAWLRVYPRKESRIGNGMNINFFRRSAGTQVARIFASSPAVISGGQIFALPVDGKSLLVLDEADGRVIKQVQRASLDGIDTLVGLSGKLLVVAGERVAATFDWTQASEDATPQSASIQWKMDFPANSLRGRPFLTTDSLFLPTDDRLLRVETRHWKIEQATPPYPAVWTGSEGPGNVLVTQEHVVVATNRQVNVYTNLSAATARLDREIAAAPGSVEPLVRYGELLFAAGRTAGAVEKLQAALRITPPPAPGNTEVRDRLFNASLTSATRLASVDMKSPHIDGLLDVARQSASAPGQLVQYHLTGATIELRRNNGSESLKHLQAILDDPASRATVNRDSDQATRSAGDIARRQIGLLIDRYGASVYQQIQLQAQRDFAAAQQSRDVSALLEIASRFPNSLSAIPSLLSAGQLLEQAGRFPEAASIYRRLVQDYSSDPAAATFIEAMARAYAAIPGKARVAATRLAQGAALYGDPLTTQPLQLPGGQLIQKAHFSEVAEALKQAAGLQRPPVLPDLGMPPFGTAAFREAITIGNIAADKILPPAAGTPVDYTRSVVLLGAGDIAVVDTRQAIAMRTSGLGFAEAIDCAWASPTRLVLRSPQQLVALDTATGKVAWRIKPDTLPAAEQLADAAAEPDDESDTDDGLRDRQLRAQLILQRARLARMALAGAAVQPPPDGITEIAIAGGHVIAGTSTGRVFAADTQTGALAWQAQPDNSAVTRISASDDFVAVKTASQRRSVLLVLDNANGKVLMLRSIAGNALQNILVSEDGQLVYTTMSKIASRDLYDLSDRLLFEVTASNPLGYNGQDRPDQLIMVDDTIAAVTDNGACVRLFSRYTGKQMLAGGRETNNIAAAALPATARPSRTKLVAASPFVYAYNQSAIRAINLQRSENADRRLPGDATNLKALAPGAMHLVAIDQPLRLAEAQSVPQITVFAFSRAAGNSGESGRLDHMATLKQDAGIVTWQIAEGGMFLSLADKRLVFVPTNH